MEYGEDRNVRKCGHCDGRGVCERGEDGWSCATCLAAAVHLFLFPSRQRSVKCSVCDGTGWIHKADMARS